MARRRTSAADASARASANVSQSIPAGPPVDVDMLMPGRRERHDGWNQDRVQRFLDALLHTGCVEDAARVAGMSANGARRMRGKYPRFAAAWDAALARGQQSLIAVAWKRAVEGRETVILRKGEEHERRIEPSDAMLGLLIKRGDLKEERAIPDPDSVITREEWLDGWTFDGNGRKVKDMSEAEAAAIIWDRLERLRTVPD